MLKRNQVTSGETLKELLVMFIFNFFSQCKVNIRLREDQRLI